MRVSRNLSTKQFNYLYWWSTRSRYHNIIHRLSFSQYIFELSPNALSWYAISRLREKLRIAGPKPIFLVDSYPVGFESDLPPAPAWLSKLCAKRKLTRQEIAWLQGIRLVPPPLAHWGKWPRITHPAKTSRPRLERLSNRKTRSRPCRKERGALRRGKLPKRA